MIKERHIIEELPYLPEMERLGAVYNNDSVIVDRNWIVDHWVEQESTVHNCTGNGDCGCCANNDRIYYEYIVMSPIRSKMSFTFVRMCGDRLGDCWSNWYGKMTPMKK